MNANKVEITMGTSGAHDGITALLPMFAPPIFHTTSDLVIKIWHSLVAPFLELETARKPYAFVLVVFQASFLVLYSCDGFPHCNGAFEFEFTGWTALSVATFLSSILDLLCESM
jgi:hypothetical protein